MPILDGNDQMTGSYASTSEPVVSKMRNGIILNEGLPVASDLNIDLCPDHFRFKLELDSNLNSVAIQIETVDNPGGSEYDDDPDKITLEYSSQESAWVTPSMLLVSDHVDDDYPPEINVGEDDEDEDRTHLIQLGGKLKVSEIEINGSGIPVALEYAVSEKKQVYINVVILKYSDGTPVISEDEVNLHIKIAKERYAQVGTGLKFNVILRDSPEGVDLSDGGIGENLSDEMVALFDAYGTAETDDIYVFYVPYNAEGNNLHGYAFAGFGENPGVYANNIIMDSVKTDHSQSGPPGVFAPARFTLGHEIGHLLTNRAHFGDQYAESASNVEKLTNIMAPAGVGSSVDIPRGNKRFTIDQEIWIHSSNLVTNP